MCVPVLETPTLNLPCHAEMECHSLSAYANVLMNVTAPGASDGGAGIKQVRYFYNNVLMTCFIPDIILTYRIFLLIYIYIYMLIKF